MSRVFSGGADGRELRIAVAVSRFNEIVTEALLAGARRALLLHGVDVNAIDVAYVPGSFELPLAAQRLARTGRYDAVICLGAVIRGETAHFDYVAGSATSGIARAMLDWGKPVVFGVLTVDSLDQALARAGGHVGQKGFEAAMTAIEMVDLLRQIDAG